MEFGKNEEKKLIGWCFVEMDNYFWQKQNSVHILATVFYNKSTHCNY